jgi:hypothetical protein
MSVVTFLLKRNSGVTFVLEEYKREISKLIPVILLWLVTIIIYTPCELYLGNANEFPISFWYFFVKLLAVAIIIFVVSTFLSMTCLMSEHFELLYTGLFAFLVMGYIQGMFLNGDLSELDGDIQTWGGAIKLVNLVIWIIVIAVFLFVKLRKGELARQIIKFVSIWLILIQVVSLGVLIVTSDDTGEKSVSTLTIDGMLEIGNENNIFVFVLDRFDRRFMDEILESNPDFLEPLNDFTYYTNASSEFWPTECSIPFLITGTEFDDNNIEYMSYAFDNDDILIKKLYEKGYDLGVYTDDNLVSDSISDIVSNYVEGVKRTCGMIELSRLMMQVSKYKMSPFICKNYFIYDTTDIAGLVESDRVYNTSDDLPFYKRLVSQQLYVSDDKDNVFKFIHMKGAHPQFVMSEDFQHIEQDSRRNIGGGDVLSQSKGSVKIVFEYISQLKELGKYDDAMIIITADHGSRDDLGVAYPIMFVKEPYEKSEQMVISSAPVCQADLIPTIEKAAGIEITKPVIEDYTENEERTRIFRVRGGNTYKKYEINGDVANELNWKLIYSNINE